MTETIPREPGHPAVTFRGDRFVTFDNVFSATEIESAQKEFAAAKLQPMLSSINPVFDGFAFRGGYEKAGLTELAGRRSGWRSTLAERVVHSAAVLGDVDPAELTITVTPWGYPAGSRLSWHNDAGAGRVGAFVLFVHDHWDPGWGGGLVIGDTDLGPDADASALFRAPAAPRLVFPVPNRLTIFRSGTMHSLLRVDPTAGDHMRKTYTGFLLRDPENR